MKNRKIAAGLLITSALLLSVMGCGESDSTAPSMTEKPAEEAATEEDFYTSGESGEKGNANADGEGSYLKPEDNAENIPADAPEDVGANTQTDQLAGNSGREEDQLIGNVKSVSEDSFVISQIFEMEEGILVSPAEGSSDEVLVTVYISESVQYEVKTVKNSGVNGDADVEKRQGDISDLKEHAHVDISGYYEEGLFWAEKIVISIFV